MSVTAAKGFVASGVECGIRKSGRDLALVRSLAPAVGAGMFTTNRVQAAPVRVSKAHLAVAEPQAVVVNSGVANAATGDRGELDALATAADAALLLDVRVEEVLVLSTGVIGVHLPLDRLRDGLERAAGSLSPGGGADAAEAILTTDTRTKEAVAHGGEFVVGGMAKGAGMIHPALATMLAVVTTDYPLGRGEAEAFLRPAVEATFNRISVDGECSTNDAVVLLANGASCAARDDDAFAEALHRSAAASRAGWWRTPRARPSSSRCGSPARPTTGKRPRSRGALQRRHWSRRPLSGETRTGAASWLRRARRRATAASPSSRPGASALRSTGRPSSPQARR